MTAHLRSLSHLILLLLIIAHLPRPLPCRTLTWIADGEGSLLDPSNWDTHTTPQPDDDCVISLPSPPSPSPSPFSTSTLLSPSFSPSSLDDALDDAPLLLTLPSPLTVSSLTLTGRFTLLIDAPLTIDLSLTLSPSTTLRARNTQLTLTSLSLLGLLSLESSSLSSTPLTPLPSSTTPLPTLRIHPDAALLTSGPGAANHLKAFNVLIEGALITSSPPLLLSHTTLHLQQGGVWVWGGELVSVEGEGEDSDSVVINAGTLIASGEAKQSLVVPLHNLEEGEVRLRSPALSLLTPLTSAGLLSVGSSHRLTAASLVTLTAASILTLAPSSTLLITSSSLLNAGVIKGGGRVVVGAAMNNSGEVRVGRVVMKDGGVLGVDGDASTHLDTLLWEGGVIAGQGTVEVGEGRVAGGLAPKVVEGVELVVQTSMLLQPASAVLLRGGGQVTVAERGTMTLLSSSSLRADDERSQLLILGSLTSNSTPVTAEDSSDPAPTSISLPLTCKGNLTLTGAGTTILHRTSLVQHLHASGSPTLTLQAIAERTSFTFPDTVDMTAEGSALVVLNANVSFTASTRPRIDQLDVREGRVEMSAGVFVRKWRVGSAQAPGVVDGVGTVDVEQMVFEAGEVVMDQVHVHSSLVVERVAAKLLQVRNLTLLSSSVSRVASASLSLSPSTFIVVEPSASLVVGPEVSIFSAHLAGEESEESRGEATIRVREGGLVAFEGSGHGVSGVGVALIVEGAVTVNNTANGVFTVTLRGVTSRPTASFTVSSSSSLVLACPVDSPTSCNYGHMEGQGSVVVALGRHLFPSSIAVSSLSMTGGSGRFLAPLTLSSLQLTLGEMLLDSAANVTHFTWTGGALRGYPLLGSSVTVSAGGHALISSHDTLTLDGTALLVACPMQWVEGGLMMRNSALLNVLAAGELRLGDGDREVQVMSDSSTARIENDGSVTITSLSTLHVPFINTGHLTIANDSVVTLQADYVQAALASSLRVEEGSALVKLNGDLIIVQGSLAVDGVVQGSVEAGGRVILSSAGPGGSLQGDLIFVPSSTLLMRRDGRALFVNGSVHASGSVEVEDGQAAAAVRLITATSTTGAFRPSSHQRLSYDGGTIAVRQTGGGTSDEVDSLSSYPPTLYLPFARLPESTSASLVSEAGKGGPGAEGESAASQEGGRGVLGWSAESTAALLAVLASLWFITAGIAVCFARKWWKETRRHHRRSGGNSVVGTEPTVAEGRIEREQQPRATAAMGEHGEAAMHSQVYQPEQ